MFFIRLDTLSVFYSESWRLPDATRLSDRRFAVVRAKKSSKMSRPARRPTRNAPLAPGARNAPRASRQDLAEAAPRVAPRRRGRSSPPRRRGPSASRRSVARVRWSAAGGAVEVSAASVFTRMASSALVGHFPSRRDLATAPDFRSSLGVAPGLGEWVVVVLASLALACKKQFERVPSKLAAVRHARRAKPLANAS